MKERRACRLFYLNHANEDYLLKIFIKMNSTPNEEHNPQSYKTQDRKKLYEVSSNKNNEQKTPNPNGDVEAEFDPDNL